MISQRSRRSGALNHFFSQLTSLASSFYYIEHDYLLFFVYLVLWLLQKLLHDIAEHRPPADSGCSCSSHSRRVLSRWRRVRWKWEGKLPYSTVRARLPIGERYMSDQRSRVEAGCPGQSSGGLIPRRGREARAGGREPKRPGTPYVAAAGDHTVRAHLTQRADWCPPSQLLTVSFSSACRSLFTIVYGIAEGTIGLALGSETVSISLLAFGADSWVEVISGSLVCWRFYEELRNGPGFTAKRTATQKERIATFVLGLLLCLLSSAVIGGSIGALVIHEAPESSLANIIVGAVSIAYMGTLYVLKTRVAISLKSSTIETDAQCSLFCVQLSLVLVVGGIIFREVSSVWWFDSATAIVIALMIGKEGVETVRASQKKDFTGAGCGCDGEDDGWLMRFMRKKIKKDSSNGTELHGVKVITVASCIDGGAKSCCASEAQLQQAKASCCGHKGEKSHCSSAGKPLLVENKGACCGDRGEQPQCSTAARLQPVEVMNACCGDKGENPQCLSDTRPQPVEAKGACGEKSHCSPAAKPQPVEVKNACGGKGEQSHCSCASGKCKSGC